MVYQFNSDMLPDARFVPGELKHLVPGNEARLLDPRRTPLRVLELKLEVGAFVVELIDFEDKGARWELPFEDVDRCQFALGCVEAEPGEVAQLEEIIARLDRPLVIAADRDQRATTDATIASLRVDIGAWLDRESAFFRSGAELDTSTLEGDPALWSDLERSMKAADLWDIEEPFAEQYVANPRSGELVKGHRIVLAELGLAAFEDKLVRDPMLFVGAWSKPRRAAHILHRLAFVREILARSGHASLVLYRGLTCQGQPERRGADSFVSATFSLDIAMSHFNDRDRASTGVLLRQSVPSERVFMTYLETAPMNRHYKEAEAVLLQDEASTVF